MFLLKAKNFYLTLRNFDIILPLKLGNSRIPRNLLEKLFVLEKLHEIL